MAKLSILPLIDQPLKNGNIPIHIRISHAGGRAMMATEYSVSPKRIKDRKISDTGLNIEITNKILAPMMDKMRKIANIDQMTARQVMDRITASESLGKIDSIDFIYFAAQHIEKLIESNQRGSARNFQTLINVLADFTGRSTLYTFEVTLHFLNEFTSYLMTERKIIRLNQGKTTTCTKPALSDQTINNYIKDFRTLFNACRDKFNDLDIGMINIPNYPFKKYKFRKIDRSTGFRSIEIKQLAHLAAINPDTLTGRKKIARDMYLLSFYLIGINPTDLYDLTKKDFKDGRINYYRNKTKGRRADKAFISIQVPPQALEIIEQYKGQERLLLLNVKYTNVETLIRAVNTGLKELAKICHIENESFTWYSARHTWASIARNECGYSLEDVGLALNHVSENKVTGDYIKRDWSLIDKMNTKVIQKVLKKH